MLIEKHHLETRDLWLTKAKGESSFIDAVFLINYYNREQRPCGPRPWPSDIAPSEVFVEYNNSEFKTCLERADALLTKSSYVGASHWGYENAAPYEEAVSRMKLEHPGFSEYSYKLTAQNAASHMKW